MRAFFGRAAMGAAFVIMLGACSSNESLGIGGSSGGNNSAVEAEYDLAVKRWEAGAPLHYRIVVQQTCECSVEMQRQTRVTVRRTAGSQGETIETVVDAGTGTAVSQERLLAAKSVDGLLAVIQEALGLNPAEARVTYDATLGYPISINIDPVTSIAGDEVVYKVTSFETIP